MLACILLVADSRAQSSPQAAASIPRYRHFDPAAAAPAELPQGIVRMLTDRDFAPFSFVAADGSQAGLSVELARAACAELRLACEVVPLPFADLLPALERGDGDVIITGIRLTPDILAKSDTTRPYFVSTGRFYILKDTKLVGMSVRALGGKRLGYVRGTQHGAFVEKYYGRSTLIPFESAPAMFRALKAKEVDIAFGDGLYAMFWLKGPEAAACCATIGGSMVDRETFSRGLTFLARKDRKNLRQSLDFALDRLEEKGATAKIMSRYLPSPAW